MGHGHDHHGHTHGPPASVEVSHNKAFLIAVGLNIAMVVAELIFGIVSDSMALIADAGHNFSDVIGIVAAWIAAWMAARPARGRFSYGYRRATILAALFSGLLLLLATGGIIWEAIRRLIEPEEVAGGVVIVVALIGVVINTISALLFAKGSKNDLNIRGAFLHLLGDAGVSVGVAISGAIILFTGWQWVDPVASLLVAGVILWATWGLLRESLYLAMDATPMAINGAEVEKYLSCLPGVTAVHDLHIWPLGTTDTALTAHLVRPNHEDQDAFLKTIREELQKRFQIRHVTIQIEHGNENLDCHTCPL